MKHQQMLYEAIDVLECYRSQQDETDSCVVKRLDQTIAELESLKAEKLSEPELACSILIQLGLLFSEFPEVREYIEGRSESDAL